MAGGSDDVDYLIIGGGFYGCCLALFLRSLSANVLIVEADKALMLRASRVNQARIHTGFHYPRSALTAIKSMILRERFIADFPDAVVDDFQMLYAIAKRRSKVTSRRFYRMFRDVGAPIEPASPSQSALFNSEWIEAVFACQETAFDCDVLRHRLGNRLDTAGVEVRLGTKVMALTDQRDGAVCALSDGTEIHARRVFNITYASINELLDSAGLPCAQLKHELTEIALVEPPPELAGLGVTVMDGPFFSCMPYPTRQLYSLTHVRYTPHESWTDDIAPVDRHAVALRRPRETRVWHMIRDGQRYLPCMAGAHPVTSLFEVKTVLIKNESDDGRPILFQRLPVDSRVISILGGKLDNVYDLFDLVRQTSAEFADATDELVAWR